MGHEMGLGAEETERKADSKKEDLSKRIKHNIEI